MLVELLLTILFALIAYGNELDVIADALARYIVRTARLVLSRP